MKTINRCRELISELVEIIHTAQTLAVKSVRVGFVAHRNDAIQYIEEGRGVKVVLDASVIHPDLKVREEQAILKEERGKDYEWMESLDFFGVSSYGGNSNMIRASLKMGIALSTICDWDEFLDVDAFTKSDLVTEGKRVKLNEARIAGEHGVKVIDQVLQSLGVSSHTIGKKTTRINQFLLAQSFEASKLEAILNAETEKDEGKDKDKDEDKIIVKVELSGDDYVGDLEKVCRQVGKHYELTTMQAITQWGMNENIKGHDCPTSFRALADAVRKLQDEELADYVDSTGTNG